MKERKKKKESKKERKKERKKEEKKERKKERQRERARITNYMLPNYIQQKYRLLHKENQNPTQHALCGFPKKQN